MKSTVYPDHPRASASFAYRHLLYCTENEETPTSFGLQTLPMYRHGKVRCLRPL
jgi:hypothetical protein